MKRVKRICLIAGMAMLITPLVAQKYIADYEVAKEEVLRSIPEEFIDKARTELHVAYQHTSHGTHVSRGVFGLPDFESGDDVHFAISASQQAGKLDFRDYALSSYAPAGIDGSDLSRNETAFIQTTRNYLDAPENASINVIMWSWCNIAGHNVSGNYLPGMDSLIGEYGVDGSKIGTGEGQREVPVTFIFMTGHANVDANVGELKPKSQVALINDHCNTNGYFCLDYYSIDTHDMDDNYWEDTGDNGNSASYGGNFYVDWQNSHALGTDYFENKTAPGGDVAFGAHNTQHITANRKAYAMWWILARISGWDGNPVTVVPVNQINISSAGGVTEMTTGDTLQFSAEVLPADATNKDITWSVTDQTGSGTITQGGLLTAVSEGTINVIATPDDGSGATGSLSIQITGQTTAIEGQEHNELHVYPNPGNGNFVLRNVSSGIDNIKIFRTDGVEIFNLSTSTSESVITMDISDYPSGVYVLRLLKGSIAVDQRVIIMIK